MTPSLEWYCIRNQIVTTVTNIYENSVQEYQLKFALPATVPSGSYILVEFPSDVKVSSTSLGNYCFI